MAVEVQSGKSCSVQWLPTPALPRRGFVLSDGGPVPVFPAPRAGEGAVGCTEPHSLPKPSLILPWRCQRRVYTQGSVPGQPLHTPSPPCRQYSHEEQEDRGLEAVTPHPGRGSKCLSAGQGRHLWCRGPRGRPGLPGFRWDVLAGPRMPSPSSLSAT